MRRAGTAAFMLAILLIPTYAHAQTSQIILLDTFGDFERGDQFFVFGEVSQVLPDLFVVIQIVNPNGDLCQVQQLKPLSDGHFITDTTPLTGRICGLVGEYAVKVFYGDHSQASSFSVTGEKAAEVPEVEYLLSGTELVESKIASLKETVSENQLAEYSDRLDQIRTISSLSSAMLQLRDLYSDLLSVGLEDSDIYDLDVRFRPSIETALDMTKKLVTSSIIDQAEAKKINSQIYSVMFYSRIGNDQAAINALNDVYVQITNVDPQKVQSEQPRTYEEINQLVLNLMTKSNSVMNRELKEEIGFIFARGTGPLYVEELESLLDILTKARTLDATLKREDSLTLLIKTEWEVLRESLLGAETLETFVEKKDKVDKLYDAIVLVRSLDKVDRFTSGEQKSELAVLLEPRLDDLLARLQSATSPDDILAVEQDILDMKNVIDISSRISTTISFSKKNNADSKLIASFEALLDKVKGASTLNEILAVVSEFDGTINDLREKRSPLSVLKFEYEKLKSKAELQADYESLVKINNAIRIINTAIELDEGNPTINRIDKIEVLLSWASQQEPIIQAKLDSYTKDAYKIRASDILQRAKSLENLADLGTTHNRFLPGYSDYTKSLKERVLVAQNLVVKGDLDGADSMVRELFAEWQQVSKKYSDDPFGSPTGYSADEIKRIEYREKLEALSSFATSFYNADFEEHAPEFNKMKEKAYNLVDYGNFVDVDSQIKEIRKYLSENLEMENKKIIFDISYNPEKEIWIMSGALDKQIMDRRENLYLTVYDMHGDTHSTLKFSDTKHGELFTQWYAPSDPGLYVVVLQYQSYRASQIVDVPEKEGATFSKSDLANVDYAREYDELKSFVDTFGGANYDTNKGKFDDVMSQIETALGKKDFSTSQTKISELQSLIERYLPNRSRTAVIEAYVQDDKLYISGALYKTIAFSEDIYVDVFNQKGDRVDEILLKDTASGYFNQVLSKNYEPGIYVAQLQYHELTVSDFFKVS